MSRLRAAVRSARSKPVIGPAMRAADRVWWARVILRSDVVDQEYYAAQRGRRSVSRRQAVWHYISVGFRRGLSLNPLFDDIVAGADLPEVLRVPAMYAYLVSERETVQVNPWWDAVEHGAVDGSPPLEAVWADHRSVLRLRAGDAATSMTVGEYREHAISAARGWARTRWADAVAPPARGGTLIVRPLQARDRGYHRKLAQLAGGSPDARAVVALVGVDASQWVSTSLLRFIDPTIAVHAHAATTPWAAVVAQAVAASEAETIVVLDARAEFSDDSVERLAQEARFGAAVIPAHLRIDGTLQGIGAASIGRAWPARILSQHPVEDLAGVGPDPVEVPLLTGRTFAVPRAAYERVGGLDSTLVNGGELEVFSAALTVADDLLIRVLPDVRPVLEEPELAFSRRARRRNYAVLRSHRWNDGRERADALIEDAGFSVLGWSAGRRHGPPSPRLAWRRPSVDAMRWAIKICSPAGRKGAVWGDTHFAHGLASALRRRGHDVVIDAFDANGRATEYLDDVSVVIRGPYRIDPPATGVRLQWIISHPDDVSKRELAQFDRVFAASERWSRRMSAEWGIDIDPLLECTDTDLFHPRGLPRSDDIVFVGTARGIARPSVVAPLAAGIPVKVYGPDWRPFIPQSAVAATSIPHAGLADRYETASIVLNDQWPAMRREGFMAMRPFDAVAVGARVVSEEVDGIVELFGGAVATYRDAAHLVSILRADPDETFPDEAEMARISERIRTEHSFDARARVLDEAIRVPGVGPA